MVDWHEEVVGKVIRALARATLAATANGFPGVAFSAIEILYVITSRIRPGLATGHIIVSSHAAMDYTVRGLEAQVSADLRAGDAFTCAQDHAHCVKGAKETVETTVCLMTYAACVGDYFTAAVEA